MKKLLLSILCVLGFATMATAGVYTFNMADQFGTATLSSIEAWTAGDFKFVPSQEGGNNAPAFNKAGDVRLYAKNTLTITATSGKITGIQFDLSAQGLKRIPEIAVSAGAISAQGAYPLVWLGDATEVTFTVGDLSIGTEAGKPGQLDFTALTIYTDGDSPEAGNPDTPAEATTGVYTATTAIADGNYLLYANGIIATPIEATKNYGYLYTTDATDVDGTITTAKANQFTIKAVDGGYTIQGPDGRYYIMTGTYNSFNLSAERTDGDVWTIAANNDGTAVITNVAMEKSIQFDANYNSFGSYPDVRGVYPTLYVFTKDADGTVVPPAEPEVPVVDNINALYDFENNAKFEMGANLTVVYANGAYVYVYDGFVYGLIYKNGLGLNPGDVIAKGWKGKVSIYNELIELVPNDDTLATDGTADVPEPIEIEDADMASVNLMPYNQNAYIKLIGVNIAEATPDATNATFYGTMGEGDDAYTITFRNPFKLAAVEPGSYDIIAFVGLYKESVQINPVEYTPNLSGINSIVDENAPVKYYNIQGMPIANPQPGNIYIRVQGKNATKVIK